MLCWLWEMRVVLFWKGAFCVIFTPCYRECSDKKKIFIPRRLSLTKTEKGQCWSLEVYLVKAPRICTVPNVIKCNKNDFWKKKGSIRERCFSPFAFSPAVYCNDQPNALDTAVRCCSYTLTLHVLNDSGRMNHVAEVDFLHLSILTIIAFFISKRQVFLYFTQGASSRCGWPKACILSELYKCVKLLKDEAIISAIRFTTKANWKIHYIMLSNSARRLCYQAHFPY